MQTVINRLNEKIEAKHLLKHPFYQAWSAGQLSVEDLKFYSQQYFAHVRAFPAYLSEMHCRCEDLDARSTIARNLADEEARTPTHPELWLDFAAGLGVDRDSVLAAKPGPGISALVSTYRELSKLDTPLAAVALYCYERQIPDVACAKIAGLKEQYGITAPSTLRYFEVHEEADVEHSQQLESILSKSNMDPDAACSVADKALDALWGALSDIHETCLTARTAA